MKTETIKQLGLAYHECIGVSTQHYNDLKPKPRQTSASWIGRHAEELWFKRLQHLCVRTSKGKSKGNIGIDPSTAVSNLGNSRRADAVATIGGERVMFELKKSDYRGDRAYYQKAAQVWDLGMGTYGATALYRISAENGKVDVWTREQAQEAVASATTKGGEFELPSPSNTIVFASDDRKL